MSNTVKIIVTLSEGQYEALKDVQFGGIGSRMVFNAVKHGTPLPKGHGRLIDADKLNEQFGEVMDAVMREPKFTKDVEYILRTTATVRLQIKEADTIIEADKEESEE